MNRIRYSQGEKIAAIIYFLASEGSKSYPELKKRFSMISESTLQRDMKLLRKTKVVREKKEARIAKGVTSKKVFLFFKDDEDIVGKTKRAMEILKRDFRQVTLDRIASISGLPPTKIQEVAYSLAPKLDLLIGKEVIEAPPAPLVAGAQDPKKKR